MTTVAIELDGIGHGTVLVEGMDLSDVVRAVRIEAEVGQRPRILLDVVASASSLTTDASVGVLVSIGKDSGAGSTLADALRALADIIEGSSRVEVPI